jgi:outer membrane protein TolC
VLIPAVTLDFTQPLTPDEVTVVAVLANPDLRALRTKESVAAAQLFASGLFPDPQVSLSVDKLLSPKDQGLVNGYAGGLSLDLLGALATRSIERQAARTAANQTRLDIAWHEWTTAGQARLLAVRLPYQMQAAVLAEKAAASADRILTLTLAATERGDLKGDELEARRIAAADATVRAAAMARDAQSTQLELNRMLGLKPDETLAVAGPAALAAWTAPDPNALFQTARSQRLDLQALAQGYASQEATLHRAILGQYPRLGIAVTRARDTSAVHTLSPAVSLDLPIWNRNWGAISVARADRTRLRAEFAARLHQTRADIAALVAGINRDEAPRVAVAAGMADIERIADSFDESAARGDVTLQVADSARAAAIDKQILLLALEQSCAEQRIALALATGTPFP